MAAIDDVSVGFGVESTYGTAVTPTRWLEFTDEALTYTPNKVQGEGLRVGSYVARSNKRVTTTYDGGGVVTHETISKGMGLLLQAAFGTGTSTLVSGTTYQQLFTLGTSPSPLTIQKGVVAGDAGGTRVLRPEPARDDRPRRLPGWLRGVERHVFRRTRTRWPDRGVPARRASRRRDRGRGRGRRQGEESAGPHLERGRLCRGPASCR